MLVLLQADNSKPLTPFNEAPLKPYITAQSLSESSVRFCNTSTSYHSKLQNNYITVDSSRMQLTETIGIKILGATTTAIMAAKRTEIRIFLEPETIKPILKEHRANSQASSSAGIMRTVWCLITITASVNYKKSPHTVASSHFNRCLWSSHVFRRFAPIVFMWSYK